MTAFDAGKKLRLSIKPQVSIREKVYRVIRDDILNNRFMPGERLVETKLARQIHTSRTPIREALHVLEREGLLESIPRVGYRVREMKWTEVEEICEIRVVNETLAARWAMERITPEKIQALEENIFQSKKDAQNGDPRSFVVHDAEFHELLAGASGSKRLLELCQLLRRHMLRYRMESLNVIETACQAAEGHARILDCLKRRDEVGLGNAMREHLEYAKESIRTNIPWERGERSRTPKNE
jgi:GntR family transcriptional regulator, rspAB operon transcriptional repressor